MLPPFLWLLGCCSFCVSGVLARHESGPCRLAVLVRVSCFCALRVRAAPLRLLAPSRPTTKRCRSGEVFSWRSLRTVDQTAGTRQPGISGSRRLSVWGPVLARNTSSWYGPSAPVKVVPPSPAASTLTVLAGPGDFALRISRREYCQEQKIVMISLH
jgi:hypothetical protein